MCFKEKAVTLLPLKMINIFNIPADTPTKLHTVFPTATPYSGGTLIHTAASDFYETS